MKRTTLLILTGAMILCLAACGGAPTGGKTSSFEGEIIELNESGAIILANEDDPIRSSSDKISISTNGLADIGAEIGDIVKVEYTGVIMEKYPAQVIATDWEIIEKMSKQPILGAVVSFENKNASMSLILPEGWDFETVEKQTQYGLAFFPEANPDVRLQLLYHEEMVGICGTGVTIEDITLANGIDAKIYTEGYQSGEYWFFMSFDEAHLNYNLDLSCAQALWKEYESEIYAIIDGISFGD